MIPFPTEIQNHLWVETDGPWEESCPSQNLVRDFQRNWIPRSHFPHLSLSLRDQRISLSLYNEEFYTFVWNGWQAANSVIFSFCQLLKKLGKWKLLPSLWLVPKFHRIWTDCGCQHIHRLPILVSTKAYEPRRWYRHVHSILLWPFWERSKPH